ncbi:MAG: hypothetical protein LC437_05905 [Thiohalomonas sp.]|nr:hypothetical protein [Thiohalomonas sp.]
MTDLEDDIVTILQHYRDRADCENNFDELKNQWGWVYDWGTFYGDIKNGHFQLYSLTWVGISTPDIFRYVFHSDSLPPLGANRARLNNALIDQLIEKAEQQSLTEQANTYQELQEQLQRLLPYVSLWYEDNIAFFQDDIHDYRVSSDGNYDALKQVQRLLPATKAQGSK